MLVEFLKFIKESKLCEPTDRILLAVSGGVDSMVMANLFLKGGFHVGLAHINYGLRGEDSLRDEQIVRSYAQKENLPFWTHQATQQEMIEHGSIQMAAREIRYKFFEEVAEKEGFHKVATAHHLNDSLETILLNLVRGTGINGLKGVPIKNESIIRPLLFATKEQILQYATDVGLTWGEDITNLKSIYHRNLIRNEVIPLLRQINPGLMGTMEDTLKKLQGTADIVAEAKRDFLTNHARYDQDLLILNTGSLTDQLRSTVLLGELIADYGFNFSQAEDIHAAIIHKRSGGLYFSEEFELNVDRNRLIIRKKSIDTLPEELKVEHDERAAMAFGLKITFSTEPFTGIPKSSENQVAYLDSQGLTYPLIFRKWKEGDKFTPLGMKGKKMVSDFMIDNKIPLTLKRDLIVLESGNRIAWLVNHRISDHFKVTTTTSQVLKITVEHV